MAWNAHVATDSRTTAASTVIVTRRALPGVIAIQRASLSNGTPGTAWLACRWCGGEPRVILVVVGAHAPSLRAPVSRAGDADHDEGRLGRMPDTASHVVETLCTRS